MNKLNSDQILNLHLSNIQVNGGVVYFSALVAGIRDARKFTGRNLDSGQVEIDDNDINGCWLGVIGYLILLDQIGKCFKPVALSINFASNTASVLKTLEYFTDLTSAERHCIYALRCALAHDYGLYNINKKKTELTHHFKLYSNSLTPIVELPRDQWDGDFNSKNDNNCSIVNLRALGDLVEKIFAELKLLASKNQLEIILEGGSEELSTKYACYKFHR